jgi:formimidoylglutamate deiminase
MQEELRWLEYGQRLFYQARAVTRIAGSASSGAALYRRCLEGGAQASGRKTGKIEKNCRADFIVLDGDAPDLAGKSGDDILDVLIFAANANLVRDVFCGGRRVVKDGHHAAESAADDAYRDVLKKLLS